MEAGRQERDHWWEQSGRGRSWVRSKMEVDGWNSKTGRFKERRARQDGGLQGGREEEPKNDCVNYGNLLSCNSKA